MTAGGGKCPPSWALPRHRPLSVPARDGHCDGVPFPRRSHTYCGSVIGMTAQQQPWWDRLVNRLGLSIGASQDSVRSALEQRFPDVAPQDWPLMLRCYLTFAAGGGFEEARKRDWTDQETAAEILPSATPARGTPGLGTPTLNAKRGLAGIVALVRWDQP